MDKWLRNNNVVKVVALLVGVLLWLVVRTSDVQNPGGSVSNLTGDLRYNNVKIEAEYDENQYKVSLIDPSEVAVILRGKPSDLKKASIKSFKVKADLSKYVSGTYTVFLHSSGLPDNVTAEIIPQAVKVVIEEKQMKEVDVIINPVGTPAEGYKVGNPVVTPSRVHVTVPESRLDDVGSARAEVNVDNAKSTVAKQVTLTVYDKQGKPMDDLEVSPRVVDVEVPVTSPFKLMPLQIKLTGQPDLGYSVVSVKQNPEQITVFAQQEVLDLMEFYEGPQIDLTGLQESQTFTIDLEPNNQIIDLNPTKVEVTVEISPSATRAFNDHKVDIIGVGDNMTAKLVTPEDGRLDVVLEGAPALLNQMKASDLQAVVDVSNLPPGLYELPINLNLPLFIKKASEQQEIKATVEIAEK
ncbi:YbbR-like domain-containing protein [Paenibacillus sp. J2TS4]|uniref:CdaR family protein n=1 Tax=Paenibacillus sp. J2TS4 TaxID=2807194 RepID=UPI001B293C01|nr:CdaR family protein [Paenibacillus sp. J2TS4]GIP34956.1 CdaA regulatory protein CdaR [Paenibacillus sp. J2TS4]